MWAPNQHNAQLVYVPSLVTDTGRLPDNVTKWFSSFSQHNDLDENGIIIVT